MFKLTSSIGGWTEKSVFMSLSIGILARCRPADWQGYDNEEDVDSEDSLRRLSHICEPCFGASTRS
eukprot:4516688-Amphidinium_carterae.1